MIFLKALGVVLAALIVIAGIFFLSALIYFAIFCVTGGDVKVTIDMDKKDKDTD